MTFKIRNFWWLIAPLTFLASSVTAQEFSVLVGEMSTPSLTRGSYAWELEYRHGLYKSFEASVAWINEGHVVGHHRDGTTAEIWYRIPTFDERLPRLSLGAGPYYFYDTRPLASGGSENVHGVAPILSVSLDGELCGRFFWRVMANRIQPNNDIATNSFVVGIGYYFGKEDVWPKDDFKPLFGPPLSDRNSRPNEVTVFGGWSVLNTLSSEGAKAFAVEYRRDLNDYFDCSISYIYEGDPKIVRRSGTGLQVWPVTGYFKGKLEAGFGVGVYLYVDHKRVRGRASNQPAALAGLVSPMLTYRLNKRIFGRFIWDRVVTSYNRDADIWLCGVGYNL